MKYKNMVKKSKVIGLLLYGPAVKGLIEIAEKLKRLVQASGKICVTISLGRVTVAKLANFIHIDLWVSLACINNYYIDNSVRK